MGPLEARAPDFYPSYPLLDGTGAMAMPLSTVQSHMPNRSFVVTTATQVTVPFCCHNSVLSCFILHETFYMLQQQDTLYFGYTNLGSHTQFHIIKSNRLRRHVRLLLYQFSPGMDCIWGVEGGIPLAISQAKKWPSQSLVKISLLS